jgi:hypothetical protein
MSTRAAGATPTPPAPISSHHQSQRCESNTQRNISTLDCLCIGYLHLIACLPHHLESAECSQIMDSQVQSASHHAPINDNEMSHKSGCELLAAFENDLSAHDDS